MVDILQELVLIPILTVLTGYFIKWVNLKSEELKLNTDDQHVKGLIDLVNNIVKDCVLATNQTYVKALKKDNIFTKEAQEEAFKITYDSVVKILSSEAEEYITSTYGDLETYLTYKIEAEVNAQK